MALFSNIFSTRRSQPPARSPQDLQQSLAEIEEQLHSQANELLESWQRDTEVKLNQSVSSLMNGLFSSLGSQLGAKTPAPRIDLGDVLGASGGLDKALRPLENQVNRWIRGTVDEWFSSEKTTVNASESGRSQEALDTFRQSRSQRQSQAAQEAQQGQRNL